MYTDQLVASAAEIVFQPALSVGGRLAGHYPEDSMETDDYGLAHRTVAPAPWLLGRNRGAPQNPAPDCKSPKVRACWDFG